jgi:DNA-binding phage protein
MSNLPYRFRGKDPVIALLGDAIKTTGMTLQEVADASGVSYSCLYAWFSGDTNMPRFASVQRVAMAVHREFKLIESNVVRLRRAA